jgi:signal transduction histidine kinase
MSEVEVVGRSHGAIRLSLRWRVAIAFGLASIAVAGLIGVATWKLATTYMLEQRRQSTTLQASVNARLVDASLRSRSDSLEELLSGLVVDPGSSVLVARPNSLLTSGRAVNTADLPPALLSPGPGEPVWLATDIDGIPVLAISLHGGSADTVFIQMFPLVELQRTQRFLLVVLAAGVAASGLLGVGLGFWTSKRALRPLTELTASAARFAAGDLQVRLPDQGDPDLGPLASTFNATVEALERRVRLDARFAGDVSHELRSPLTTMVNAIEILRRRQTALPTPARQAVDLLGGEVERFHKMLLDLLEISRADQDVDDRAMESVDLAVLVAKVGETTGGARPVVERQPPLVCADRRRLVRVVANLLDNAARHGGGVVKVTVTQRNGKARLEVDDKGPGVPVELRTQIFERFARGRHAGERGDESGSGLGLALVDRHVRLHSGSVWVEDRPGGGSRFVVELPAAVALSDRTASKRVGHPAPLAVPGPASS